MTNRRWKRGIIGALGGLCAIVNLRCGSPASNLFESPAGNSGLAGSAAGSAAGGAAGERSSMGGANGGSSSSSAGAQSSGGVEAGGGVGGATAGAANGGGSAGGVSGANGVAGGGTGSGGASGAGGTGGSSAGSANGGASGSGGAASGAGGSSAGGAGGTGGDASGAGGAGGTGAAGSGGVSGGAGATGGTSSAGSGGVSGSGGAGGTSAGTGGTASGGTASGGNAGSAGTGGGGGTGGCAALSATFTPRAPVVYFLVDRSSTMFESGYWAPVRTAVLATVNTLQSEIKFGFSAYTGVQGDTCPLDLQGAGAPALNDYGPINSVYSALASAGIKSESPTAAAVASIGAMLGASSTLGSKYLFLVTDGGQDFCDDGNMACPTDALVLELQAAKNAGVSTELFGIKGSANLVASDLQNFANAGAGAAVAGDAQATYNACSGVPAWSSLWNSLGRTTNQALGRYQTTGGSAPVEQLDTTSPDGMLKALLGAAAQTKSCTFDVSGASVDLVNAAQGVVQIDGATVPFNANNGWQMSSATALNLVGTACDKWRGSATAQVSFDFPCQILE